MKEPSLKGARSGGSAQPVSVTMRASASRSVKDKGRTNGTGQAAECGSSWSTEGTKKLCAEKGGETGLNLLGLSNSSSSLYPLSPVSALAVSPCSPQRCAGAAPVQVRGAGLRLGPPRGTRGGPGAAAATSSREPAALRQHHVFLQGRLAGAGLPPEPRSRRRQPPPAAWYAGRAGGGHRGARAGEGAGHGCSGIPGTGSGPPIPAPRQDGAAFPAG